MANPGAGVTGFPEMMFGLVLVAGLVVLAVGLATAGGGGAFAHVLGRIINPFEDPERTPEPAPQQQACEEEPSTTTPATRKSKVKDLTPTEKVARTTPTGREIADNPVRLPPDLAKWSLDIYDEPPNSA